MDFRAGKSTGIGAILEQTEGCDWKVSMRTGQEAYVGSVARDYELDRAGEPVWKAEQEWVERYLTGLPRDSSVLDVPVGTGRFLELYRDLGLRATGVDVSADMLSEARTKADALGYNTVRLEIQDARHLSFPDIAFDHCICWRLAHLISPDALRGLIQELARVTRKELVIEVYHVLSPTDWMLAAIGKAVRWISGKIGVIRDSNVPKPWSHIATYSHLESALNAAFADAGLNVRKADVLEYGTASRLTGRRPTVKIYVLARRKTP